MSFKFILNYYGASISDVFPFSQTLPSSIITRRPQLRLRQCSSEFRSDLAICGDKSGGVILRPRSACKTRCVEPLLDSYSNQQREVLFSLWQNGGSVALTVLTSAKLSRCSALLLFYIISVNRLRLLLLRVVHPSHYC